MASSTNGDAQAALEKSRKEKKEASMKRLIKVVEAEKEVRSFFVGDSSGSAPCMCETYLGCVLGEEMPNMPCFVFLLSFD